jgi:methylmalonyl-CoA mutase
MYQRGKIQEESMLYERQKHDGTLPIIGVNTFLAENSEHAAREGVALIRSSEEEKQAQVYGVKSFQARNAERAQGALKELQRVATSPGSNVFGELINTVRWCSLGQISRALYEVGGQYRRSV